MMTYTTQEALARTDAARASGTANPICLDLPDPEYPEVRWSVFDLVETNEVAVIAECGPTRVGLCAQAEFEAPSMAKRAATMTSIEDGAATTLCEQLWTRHSVELIGRAMALRNLATWTP